jgi:hypothetical protein
MIAPPAGVMIVGWAQKAATSDRICTQPVIIHVQLGGELPDRAVGCRERVRSTAERCDHEAENIDRP